MRRSWILPFFLLPAFLVGCPALSLQDVSIASVAPGPNQVTLKGNVVVTETDETEGEGKTAPEGRGVVALHLPEGWRAVTARIQVPGESTVRGLSPAPQVGVQYTEAFPKTGGVWWAFVTTEQKIHQGTVSYPIEVDLEYPKKVKDGLVGISVSPLQDEPKDLAAPALYRVDVRARTLAPTAL